MSTHDPRYFAYQDKGLWYIGCAGLWCPVTRGATSEEAAWAILDRLIDAQERYRRKCDEKKREVSPERMERIVENARKW